MGEHKLVDKLPKNGALRVLTDRTKQMDSLLGKITSILH